MLNFIKPTTSNDEKNVFFRAEKLQKRDTDKGKSPLPADTVRRSSSSPRAQRQKHFIRGIIKVGIIKIANYVFKVLNVGSRYIPSNL